MIRIILLVTMAVCMASSANSQSKLIQAHSAGATSCANIAVTASPNEIITATPNITIGC